MKILKNIFIALILMAGIFSCNDETKFPKIDTSYIAFSDASASLPESSTATTQDGSLVSTNDSYVVQVVRSTTDLSGELSVNFSLAGVFADDSDFADAGDDASSTFTTSIDLVDGNGSVTIPAGATSTSFTITSINDELSTGNRNITLELTGSSGASLQLGFADGGIGTTLNIVVVEDDCPFDVLKLTGTFGVVQTRLHNGARATYDVTVTQSTSDPLVFEIDDIFSGSTANADGVVLPIKLVTCSKSAVYEDGAIIGTYVPTGDGLAFRRLDAFFGGEPGPIFEENGINLENEEDWVKYDDVNGTITVYAWVEVPGLGSFGGYQFDLTQKNN